MKSGALVLPDNLSIKSGESRSKSPYKVSISQKDIVNSFHYKMTGEAQKEIINPHIDIKNTMLQDKRKSLIKVLMDKRPTATSQQTS